MSSDDKSTGHRHEPVRESGRGRFPSWRGRRRKCWAKAAPPVRSSSSDPAAGGIRASIEQAPVSRWTTLKSNRCQSAWCRLLLLNPTYLPHTTKVAFDKSYRTVDPIYLTCVWPTAARLATKERYQAVVEIKMAVMISVKRLNKSQATLFYTNPSLQHNPDLPAY